MGYAAELSCDDTLCRFVSCRVCQNIEHDLAQDRNKAGSEISVQSHFPRSNGGT
jgi:hypothetical protein